jgi:predicted metalloprotease with PDZ domain
VVALPVEQTWESLAGAEPEPASGDPTGWWLPGFESAAEALEVEPHRRLRFRKVSEPCAGTEISITLETAETGTRVTVVQSGFGAWFDEAFEAMAIGWSHIVADLHLYLERGVHGRRHSRPWAGLGCALRSSDTGLEVVDVYPSGFAREAGLEPGDLLLAVGEAPVLVRRELETLMRVYRTGEKVEMTWVRGDEVRSGAAVL